VKMAWARWRHLGVGWWGKLIFTAIGWSVASGMGAVIGLFLGHQFDQRHKRRMAADPWLDETEVVRSEIAPIFGVMGHLAKRDGRVSEAEIAFARQVMAEMVLSKEQQSEAIEQFRAGKHDAYPYERIVAQFRHQFHHDPLRIQGFVIYQLRAALIDGELTSREREMLLRINTLMGFAPSDLDRLIARYSRPHRRPSAADAASAAKAQTRGSARSSSRSQQGSGGQSSDGRTQQQRSGRASGREQRYEEARRGYGSQGREQRHTPPPHSPFAHHGLADAYAVLGIAATAEDASVKRAYRQLMGRHHPDRLMARGATEREIQRAGERAREINAAYERIKSARGMK
jgi:DnaJ like chaperone protein